MLLVALAPQWAAAKSRPDPLNRVGVIDARRPADAVVVGAEGVPTSAPARYVNLSEPGTQEADCCVAVATKPAESEAVVVLPNEERMRTSARQAKLSPAPATGFAGVVVAGKDARARRLTPQRMAVSWARQGGEVWVDYCLSREGMHIYVTDAAREQRRIHYYLPLGTGLKPTCPSPAPNRKR